MFVELEYVERMIFTVFLFCRRFSLAFSAGMHLGNLETLCISFPPLSPEKVYLSNQNNQNRFKDILPKKPHGFGKLSRTPKRWKRSWNWKPCSTKALYRVGMERMGVQRMGKGKEMMWKRLKWMRSREFDVSSAFVMVIGRCDIFRACCPL